MRICLYDSGRGAHFLGQKLSNFNINYFIDSKNYPYGKKSQKQLAGLIKANLKALDTQNYDYLVIACNTASIAIENDPKVTKNLKTKILKITDWLNFYDINKTDVLAIIGSTFTINSAYYQNKLINSKKVIPIDGQNLINAIEVNSKQEIKKEIEKLKNILTECEADTLILGCTHFTGVYKELVNKLNLVIIDPSSIITNYLIKSKT